MQPAFVRHPGCSGGGSLLRARGLFITLLAPTPAPTAIHPTETPKPAEGLPTASAMTEATVAEVQLEASGNLAIRRGPGLAYNTVGTLTPDQRVRVLGRNADGGWAYVELPETAGQYGWVYDGNYATLEGSIDSLETVAAEAAVPAYLRNCTFHPMRIQPIETFLPERSNDPANAR